MSATQSHTKFPANIGPTSFVEKGVVKEMNESESLESINSQSEHDMVDTPYNSDQPDQQIVKFNIEGNSKTLLRGSKPSPQY
jgi:hypothetical protein